MSDIKADEKTSNAGGENTKTDAGQGTGSENKLTFTDEQTKWINSHSDEMYAKGRSKAEKEYKEKLSASEARIKELEEQLKAAGSGSKGNPPSDDGDKGKDKDTDKGNKKFAEPSEDVRRLMAVVEELQTNMSQLITKNKAAEEALAKERKRNQEAAIKSEFLSAASKLNFFDVDDVFRLVRDEIMFDDEHGVVIRNERTGEPRMTAGSDGYRPLTLAEFLSEFAQKKPHYVKANEKDAEGGSGAGGSRTLPKGEMSDLPDFTKMSLEQVQEFATKVKTGRR